MEAVNYVDLKDFEKSDMKCKGEKCGKEIKDGSFYKCFTKDCKH
jgi:hypothetical protein